MFTVFTQPSKPLEVGHVSYSLHTGGMEHLLVNFAKFSRADRFRPTFFTLSEGGALAESIQEAGCEVVALGKRPGFRLGSVLALAREFRRRRIRVVHTHNSGAMVYGALAARLAGARAVVHTRHGQRFGARTRETQLFAATARLVNKIVGVSENCTQLSIAEGVSPTRATTIRNGIDLSRFTYTGSQESNTAIVVARLVPEKDHATLLEATALVTRIAPQFQLQIVGDGPLRSELEAHASQLGIREQVEFLGERTDVPELLARASMFVLPSKTEGISLTLLEAMAVGLPVIASRVGGNPEVVMHGQTGLLTTVEKPAALAAAILNLTKHPAVAHRMGRAGRQRAEAHFDIRRMVNSYQQLYSSILSPRVPSLAPAG